MSRFPTFRRAPLTFLLVLTLVVIHETAWLIGGADAVLSFARACAASLATHSEWWTLVASGFVHGSWDHLFRNVLWIVAFGFWLEPRLGTKRMAALVLVSNIAASMAGALLEIRGGFGASGVAFALAGALISRPFWTGEDGLQRYSGIWLLFVWITLDYYLGGAEAPVVSHAGHLGGLFSGLWFGAVRWREDPAQVAPPARLRHAGALALVTLALVATEAARPRWVLLEHLKGAKRAEKRNDLALAEHHWRALICSADPTYELDAALIDAAARYRLRRDQPRAALDLLVTIARTADTPKIHRDIGFLRARLDPPDIHGALEAWRNSYHTAPNQADVLNAMAHEKIFTDDTLLYRPEQAVDLARRAVYVDHMQEGWFMRTLACALFEVDEYDQAFRWMDHAMTRADSAAKITFEEDLEWMRQWLRENPPTRGSRRPDAQPG